MKKLNLVIMMLSSIFLLPACNKEVVHTYKIPKEKQVSLPMMDEKSRMPGMPMPADTISPRELSWTVPHAWHEQTPSAMRVASFLTKGLNDQDVDISVVSLAGSAGGDLPNVNRWRDQVGLPAITNHQLSQQIQSVQTAHFKFLLADMTSQDNLIDGKYKKRIVAAILDVQNKTWFFKMTGEDKAVESAKKTFLIFLESVSPS